MNYFIEKINQLPKEKLKKIKRWFLIEKKLLDLFELEGFEYKQAIEEYSKDYMNKIDFHTFIYPHGMVGKTREFELYDLILNCYRQIIEILESYYKGDTLEKLLFYDTKDKHL